MSTIIDGQQRLVTLSLIISVLRDMTHNSELDCYLQEKKSDVRDHLDANRINMRPELEPFFNKYIRKPLGIQPLLNLPEHSEEILHKDVERALWKNTKAIYGMFLEIKDINEFILYTLKNCYFLVVTAPEVEMAFRIFKIILDQGIDISKLDKLKSDFLLSLPADFEEFSSTWEEWRSKLGVTYFHNCVKMIRHYIQVSVHTFTIYILRLRKEDIITLLICTSISHQKRNLKLQIFSLNTLCHVVKHIMSC